MEKFGPHRMDFHEISYSRLFYNVLRKFKFDKSLTRIAGILHDDL